MTIETSAQEQEPVTETETQEKYYSQQEFDNHMARMKASIANKYEKKLSELGDIDELKRIKSEYEQRIIDEQVKRGEYDKVIQDIASKKDAEIAKRDEVIRQYKINTPLIEAASKHRAINVEQVKALLINNVRLNESGDVEVIDEKGTVRYTDNGQQYNVDDLVGEFLRTNAHFVAPTPATTHSRSNIGDTKAGKLDITKLDMTNPKDRELYKQYRKDN